MLNYNDDEQTLQKIYVSDGTVTDWAKLAFVDHTRDFLTLQKYEALSKVLRVDDFGPRHNRTEEELADPITGENVLRNLLKKGAVESESDSNIGKYLVGSQYFDPLAYLSVVHQDTPIEKLVAALSALDRGIRGETNQLKGVLDENYENFLVCKAKIDEILRQFKQQKLWAQKELERARVFNPGNNRKFDASSSLLSEFELSFNTVHLNLSLMIRPIQEHKAKEVKISKLIDFVRLNLSLFDLPKRLIGYLHNREHDMFINEYNKYLEDRLDIQDRQRRALDRAAGISQEEVSRVEEAHTMQNTVLKRTFDEIDIIAEEFRKKSLLQLLSMDHVVNLRGVRRKEADIKFIDLVEKLHRLDSDKSNPIYEFLGSQLERISEELSHQAEKFHTKFGRMQRRLHDYISTLPDQRPNGSNVRFIADKFENVEIFLRASSSLRRGALDPGVQRVIVETFESEENLDLSIINETWVVLLNYIKFIGEFYEDRVSKFVLNYVHYANPSGRYNIDPSGVLRSLFFLLINDFVKSLLNVFDVEGRVDQMKVTPASYSRFLPHGANSLSSFHYLSDFLKRLSAVLTTIGQFTVDIGNTAKTFDTNKQIKLLREASGLLDQRILEAVCATWVNDCSQFYDLEKWEKYDLPNQRKQATAYTTNMQIIHYYELFVIEKLSDLLFGKKDSETSIRIVASHPSKRVLVSLEIQFMRSINVLLDSMVKKFSAEKTRSEAEDDYDIEHNSYKLLTMNNFTMFGNHIIPHLLKRFDSAFDKTLQKQNLRLFTDLDRIKITILDDINEKENSWIESKIQTHFDNVETQKLSSTLSIDPFVYDCLMHFVKLVNVVKPITDPQTFTTIIQQLQTQFLSKFLLCLRVVSEKERIIVKILGNLKLDLDFFVEIFEASEQLRLDDYCLNLVQICLEHIQNIETMFADLSYTSEDIRRNFQRAMEYSANEFTCFV